MVSDEPWNIIGVYCFSAIIIQYRFWGVLKVNAVNLTPYMFEPAISNEGKVSISMTTMFCVKKLCIMVDRIVLISKVHRSDWL